MTLDTLDRLAARLRLASAVTVMTGAGISAESGVPTFRGKDGLWRNYSATDLATPDAFARDPRFVWEWYRWRRSLIARAQPNEGHLSLARVGRRLRGFTLITQNVDGLHQRAGSTEVIELHGNIWRARCAGGCGFTVDQSDDRTRDDVDSDRRGLPRCRCGALLRPDVVWFGEALDEAQVERAVRSARACELFVVVGTSSLVFPAAGLPHIAGDSGALVSEINLDDTPLTSQADLVIRGKAAEVLPALEARL